MHMKTAEPRVGVGVILIRNGLVLLGERKGAHGFGTWAPPGGHLEFGETVEDCAKRETLEETGLVLESVSLGPFTNDIFVAERKHYVTLFVTSNCPFGEPKLREPDKCGEWKWFDWAHLPRPLFKSLESLLKMGFSPIAARFSHGQSRINDG
jgi:8-oxo-dGTP diphosphatase